MKDVSDNIQFANAASPKAGFLQAFLDATEEVPGKPEARQRGSVQIELISEDDDLRLSGTEVYLNSIKANEIKKGAGTEAMQFLSKLADTFNVDIVLHAMGMDDDSPSDYKLVQFYKGFGFFKVGSNNMMSRSPEAP